MENNIRRVLDTLPTIDENKRPTKRPRGRPRLIRKPAECFILTLHSTRFPPGVYSWGYGGWRELHSVRIQLSIKCNFYLPETGLTDNVEIFQRHVAVFRTRVDYKTVETCMGKNPHIVFAGSKAHLAKVLQAMGSLDIPELQPGYSLSPSDLSKYPAAAFRRLRPAIYDLEAARKTNRLCALRRYYRMKKFAAKK